MRSRLKKGIALALFAGVAFFAASFAFIGWNGESADRYPGGLVLRDDAGSIIRVSLGAGDVDCRPYYRASPDDWIVKALIAVEDGSFWTHHGVRPLSIFRAAGQNLFYRRRISGASTITMQAVRLISPHPKSLWWKYKEAIMALKMERRHDKLWILSQYLNRAPYGSNLVGIEAAARGWFGKGTKELALPEAAMLAGMVQAPSRFRPDRNLDLALRRREYVLDRMLSLGLITVEQHDLAKRARLSICRSARPFEAPHFCDWTLQRLGMIDNAHGEITTSLNADLQKLAEGAVARASRDGGYSSAAVIMSARSGAVKAMACSGDYFADADGQVNTAASLRPAGSTLKPFLAAMALDRGLVMPDERLADVPKAYKGYRPENFDAEHRGLVSLRDSLVLSLNLPFVQLLQKVRVEEFGDFLRRLGMLHGVRSDAQFGLGMAIGDVDVSLVQLVSAYAVIARGGKLATGETAISPGAAWLISDMLSGEERSRAALGHIADVQLPRFAWKTGTSSAYRDAWTVAWNPEYVIGVWCGHKRGGFGDASVVGVKAAAPVVWGIARSLYPQNESPWYQRPVEVADCEICSVSGVRASGCCPKTQRGICLVGKGGGHVCPVHFLDAAGKLVERVDAQVEAFKGKVSTARKLEIVKPEDGAEFLLLSDMPQQRIVCGVSGNPAGSRLWWFVDGVQVGETVGTSPLTIAMQPGDHILLCTTAEGIADSIRYRVSGQVVR